jgi:CRISPR-associated protein Cas2
MFVSVILDMSNTEHQEAAEKILKIFGFKEGGKNIFESLTIGDATLARLKRDLDKISDSYDVIYFYQFPMEETLVISSLNKKHWKRRIIKDEGL